jgi:glycosyltransferase involved in cell wall biosynthesis
MDQTIGIVMPAYRAGATIGAAVESLLHHRHGDWVLYLVSDDGTDYSAALGLADPRIRHLHTPAPGSGASRARNVALAAMETRYAASLDADDRFAPGKLERCLVALFGHPVVSTGIDVVDRSFRHLRHVGVGASLVLTPGEHKFVNLSMDSMILWDRAIADPRYDVDLPNMNDFDFLIRLYAKADHSFHIGLPLHDYVKMDTSLSNGPGVTARMIAAKILMLERLGNGTYPLADPEGRSGLETFLRISLEAERTYPAAVAADPPLLFEDHLEPMLRRAVTQPL